MKFIETKIKGVWVIEPEPREDSRGYFARVFAKEELEKIGISYSIVHINRSLSKERGVIRGVHYQISPMEEDKIIQCLQGKIFDVALDLRKDSQTYGQWVGELLGQENKKMLLVPKGCAHGFQTLEKNSLIEYFVTQYYSPENERGIRYNDPKFKIEWPIKDAIVSEKDRNWSDYV
jgi:dTDP-4-dehydrorhamnose 3,5-epimerase